MKYLKMTPNYSKIIVPYNSTHIMTIADLVAIKVETLRIDSRCFLDKEFIKLIHMNP